MFYRRQTLSTPIIRHGQKCILANAVRQCLASDYAATRGMEIADSESDVF